MSITITQYYLYLKKQEYNYAIPLTDIQLVRPHFTLVELSKTVLKKP